MSQEPTQMPEILESKTVYIAWTNTDLTEGRGHEYPYVVCERESTARRLGKRGYVMGADCRVTEAMAVRASFSGYWMAPVRIEPPSVMDIEQEEKAAKFRELIKKSKAAGLTDEELAILAEGLHVQNI